MKDVGSVLREARQARNKTLKYVSERTKIKEKFLRALEECDWKSLPDFAITQGFAQSFAQTVGANPKLVAALLRRDYPVLKSKIKTPEIDLFKQSFWTPRTTILTAVIGTLLILAFYLFNQYRLFAAAPGVALETIKTNGDLILVSGKTVSTATVEVNNKPVLVDEDGKFSIEIGKQDLINDQVEVTATSRNGKTTTVHEQVLE